MRDRPEINEDFADMLQCLQRASVEFVVAAGRDKDLVDAKALASK